MGKETVEKDKKGNIIIKEVSSIEEELPIINEEDSKHYLEVYDREERDEAFKDVDEIINGKRAEKLAKPVKKAVHHAVKAHTVKKDPEKQIINNIQWGTTVETGHRQAPQMAKMQEQKTAADQMIKGPAQTTKDQMIKDGAFVTKEGNYEERVYPDEEVEKGSRKALIGVVLAMVVIIGIILLPQLIGGAPEKEKLDFTIADAAGSSVVNTVSVGGKQYNPQTEIMLMKGTQSIEFGLKDMPIENIIIPGYPGNGSISVKIETVAEPPVLKDMEVTEAFTIETNIADGRFARVATGEKLLFCEAWNNEKCEGGKWQKMLDLEEGKRYETELLNGAYLEAKEHKIKIVI